MWDVGRMEAVGASMASTISIISIPKICISIIFIMTWPSQSSFLLSSFFILKSCGQDRSGMVSKACDGTQCEPIKIPTSRFHPEEIIHMERTIHQNLSWKSKWYDEGISQKENILRLNTEGLKNALSRNLIDRFSSFKRLLIYDHCWSKYARLVRMDINLWNIARIANAVQVTIEL